jgi:hypothetical protein
MLLKLFFVGSNCHIASKSLITNFTPMAITLNNSYLTHQIDVFYFYLNLNLNINSIIIFIKKIKKSPPLEQN